MSDRPFQPMKLEEEREKDYLIFTVRLNKEEADELVAARKLLKQPKDSTCHKQLAKIGYKCITSQETKAILDIISGNKRRNSRMGYQEIE